MEGENKSNKLTKSNDSEKLVDALRQFVFEALSEKNIRSDVRNYYTIVSQVENAYPREHDPRVEKIYNVKLDQQFGRWVFAVSKCSTLIDSSGPNGKHEELLRVIFRFNWVASLSTTKIMLNFLVSLLVHSSQYMEMVTDFIVNAFLLPHSHPDQDDADLKELTEEKRPLTLDEVQMQIHKIIRTMIVVAPSFIMSLLRHVRKRFPHMLRDVEMHQLYIKNLLWITEYAPTLRDRILTLITERLIGMDVNAGDCSMDGGWVNRRVEKVDTVLCILLEYLKLINEHGPPLSDEVFHSILRVFERSILSTHKSRFTQFLIFYHCSFKHAYAECLLRFLLHKMFLPECPVVDRMACASYISSFVCRAAFLSAASVISTFQTITLWLHSYVEKNIGDTAFGAFSARHHRLFYCMCQGLFDIFLNREKLFTLQHSRNPEELEKLDFGKIITCRMNPFRFCHRDVVLRFSCLCRRLNLGNFNSIIKENERLKMRDHDSCLPSPDSINHQWELLTAPFSPYKLPLSSGYIDKSIFLFTEPQEEIVKENMQSETLICFEDLMASAKNDNASCEMGASDMNVLLKSFNAFSSPTSETKDSSQDSISPLAPPVDEPMCISPNLSIRKNIPKVPLFSLNSPSTRMSV